MFFSLKSIPNVNTKTSIATDKSYIRVGAGLRPDKKKNLKKLREQGYSVSSSSMKLCISCFLQKIVLQCIQKI